MYTRESVFLLLNRENTRNLPKNKQVNKNFKKGKEKQYHPQYEGRGKVLRFVSPKRFSISKNTDQEKAFAVSKATTNIFSFQIH